MFAKNSHLHCSSAFIFEFEQVFVQLDDQSHKKTRNLRSFIILLLTFSLRMIHWASIRYRPTFEQQYLEKGNSRLYL